MEVSIERDRPIPVWERWAILLLWPFPAASLLMIGGAIVVWQGIRYLLGRN